MLKNLLHHSSLVRGQIGSALGPTDGGWLCNQLPDRLGSLIQLRNSAAHGGRSSREAVSAARDEVLGIGGEGLITRIATVKERFG